MKDEAQKAAVDPAYARAAEMTHRPHTVLEHINSRLEHHNNEIARLIRLKNELDIRTLGMKFTQLIEIIHS